LYFLSAFAGNVMSFLLTPGQSLGASTAIFGLLAAETVFFIQNRRLFGARGTSVLTNLFLIAAVNLFIGFSTTGVDNWGHIGGLLGGLIFTWFGGPRYKVEGIYPLQHLVDERQGHGALSGTAAVLLFFIPLTALGWFWIVR
jgi:rhomboid protease GluP